jgi:hypothetical protein
MRACPSAGRGCPVGTRRSSLRDLAARFRKRVKGARNAPRVGTARESPTVARGNVPLCLANRDRREQIMRGQPEPLLLTTRSRRTERDRSCFSSSSDAGVSDEGCSTLARARSGSTDSLERPPKSEPADGLRARRPRADQSRGGAASRRRRRSGARSRPRSRTLRITSRSGRPAARVDGLEARLQCLLLLRRIDVRG